MQSKITKDQHRGVAVYWVQFDFDAQLITRLKAIGGRWSSSTKAWYLSATMEHALALEQLFPEVLTADVLVEIGPSIAQMRNWMQHKRYSAHSIENYCSVVIQFAKAIHCARPEDVTNELLIRFNHEIILRKNYSVNYQRQLVNALKIWLRTNGVSEDRICTLERPRKERSLPEVIAKEEVRALLCATSNMKHKTMLSLIYSAGLRIGEALNLKHNDIDSKRMVITVRGGKGNKDRIPPLSTTVLKMLREYYRIYRPKQYLFEGMNGEQYSARSAQAILRQAASRVGSLKGRKITLHTLRHSYATHLLESGTDLRYIHVLLGHGSSRTTEIYTHVSTHKISLIISPLDQLQLLTND